MAALYFGLKIWFYHGWNPKVPQMTYFDSGQRNRLKPPSHQHHQHQKWGRRCWRNTVLHFTKWLLIIKHHPRRTMQYTKKRGKTVAGRGSYCFFLVFVFHRYLWAITLWLYSRNQNRCKPQTKPHTWRSFLCRSCKIARLFAQSDLLRLDNYSDSGRFPPTCQSGLCVCVCVCVVAVAVVVTLLRYYSQTNSPT